MARKSGLAKKAVKQVVAPFSAAWYALHGRGQKLGGASRPKIVIGKARARRVVRITRAPPKRAGPIPYILSKHKKLIPKKYPQRLKQVYYIQPPGSYVELEADKQGTITNPYQLYSVTSSGPTNASIMLFNVSVTENHWVPQRAPVLQGLGYRTGNQLVGTDGALPGYGALFSNTHNDSFIYRNDATSTSLRSHPCPMYQNGLAESAAEYTTGGTGNYYNVPNNVLESISYRLRVSNPLIAPQQLSIKVVKYDNGDETPLYPGSMGDTQVDMESHIRSLCNARTWTGRGFKTLHSQTVYLPGLRAGTKQTFKNVSKHLTLNYLRSQYRKTYNATSMGALGTQAKPSFGLADDGFFNAVYIIVSSTLTTDTYVATVETEQNATNPETKETGIPQINTYPPVGLTTGTYQTIGAGAKFGIQGTVTVNHRVKETQRAIGHVTASQLQVLTDQINQLKLLQAPVQATSRDSVHSPLPPCGIDDELALSLDSDGEVPDSDDEPLSGEDECEEPFTPGMRKLVKEALKKKHSDSESCQGE